MTTHLLKLPAPIGNVKTRCDMAVTEYSPKGELIAYEGNIRAVDCPGCLLDEVIELRMQVNGFGDGPEARWFAAGQTGTSSTTIWSVMTGHPVECTDVPHDPDDFGRCVRLLDEFPRWRGRMKRVSDKYPAWMGLVGAWDELDALYRAEKRMGLYDRIKELTGR